MVEYNRLSVTEADEVTVVRFRDEELVEGENLQEMGRELSWLVEAEGRKNLLLNFSEVKFLSSAALGKLIMLDKKVRACDGVLKLSNVSSEIRDVFAVTTLDHLFDIQGDEADALAAF